MAGKMLSMNKIYKINGSAKLNVSAEKSATAHTLDRYNSQNSIQPISAN